MAEFCSTTSDAGSVVDENNFETQKEVWRSVRDDLTTQLPDRGSTPLEDWMPDGVDLSWTGRNFDGIQISRDFLEAQLINLLQAKQGMITFHRQSMQIRQDAYNAFRAFGRFEDVGKEHSHFTEAGGSD